MKYFLVNPEAGSGQALKNAQNLAKKEKEATEIKTVYDYGEFVSKLKENDIVVLCGGDGTLNRFINDTIGMEIKNDVFMYGAGSGNDFLFDLGINSERDGMIKINKYLRNLPTVEINGKKNLFINGVGFGIDGYCCKVVGKLKSEGKKHINYALIVLQGLLGAFYPRTATVTIDGNVYKFKHVWIAATMNGRSFGGGVLCTPNQDRLNSEHTLSLAIFRACCRIRALIVFPRLLKGLHEKCKKNVTILTGHDIYVSYTKPCTLQIDGEPISDVSSYHAFSCMKNG